MSDRYCIRGCTVRGDHYAACAHSGPDYEGGHPVRWVREGRGS